MTFPCGEMIDERVNGCLDLPAHLRKLLNDPSCDSCNGVADDFSGTVMGASQLGIHPQDVLLEQYVCRRMPNRQKVTD